METTRVMMEKGYTLIMESIGIMEKKMEYCNGSYRVI